MTIVLSFFVILSLVIWEVVRIPKIFRFECYYIIWYWLRVFEWLLGNVILLRSRSLCTFQSQFIGRSEGLVVPIECDQRTMEQLISGPAPWTVLSRTLTAKPGHGAVGLVAGALIHNEFYVQLTTMYVTFKPIPWIQDIFETYVCNLR